MYAKELVGKTCIREKPVMKERWAHVGGGLIGIPSSEMKVREPDYTYCTEPVKIIVATDHNIVCEKTGFGDSKFIVNLDERFCDDGWVDYDELVRGGKQEESGGNDVEQAEVQEGSTGQEPG